MKEMKETTMRALEESGKILMEGFGRHLDIKVKENHRSIVTQFDKAAEERIKSIIRERFPEHRIIGEESGDNRKDSEYTWVIDPLDGTTNFSMGSPLFNTAIGVAKGSDIVMGGVLIPFTGELFFAEKGKGATLNGKPIRVSREKELSNLVLLYCHGSDDDSIRKAFGIYESLKLRSRDTRRLGAGLIELAYVASGRAGCYAAPGTTSWDAVAGTVIVREAGGRVTDFEGREFNIESRDILASNGRIHKELLEIIKSGGK